MTSILLLGFLIGMRHAIEADHVAAVASLVTRSSGFAESMRLGSIWGLGHTLTLFLFGSLAIAMDVSISEQLAHTLEFVVGIMLLLLGMDVIRRVMRERIQFQTHQHDNGICHFHAYSHAGVKEHAAAHAHRHPKGFPVRALLVGMMHGMAGSAALIMLALQTVSSPATGLLYILLFGLGSIVGMALLSIAITIPVCRSAGRLPWLHNGLQLSVGAATIFLGSYIIVDMAIINGLWS